jgi:hypothetical protein
VRVDADVAGLAANADANGRNEEEMKHWISPRRLAPGDDAVRRVAALRRAAARNGDHPHASTRDLRGFLPIAYSRESLSASASTFAAA